MLQKAHILPIVLAKDPANHASPCEYQMFEDRYTETGIVVRSPFVKTTHPQHHSIALQTSESSIRVKLAGTRIPEADTVFLVQSRDDLYGPCVRGSSTLRFPSKSCASSSRETSAFHGK